MIAGVALRDPEILEDIGLGLYERKALMALMLCGVADAATLCREGDVPSSKIYQAMEKLAGLGLVQIQQTRPRLFAARPVDAVVARVVEIARERAERFAAGAGSLQALFAGLKAGSARSSRSSTSPGASRATSGATWRRSPRPACGS